MTSCLGQRDVLLGVLSRSPLFGALEPEPLRDLIDCLEIKTVTSGSLVLTEGEPANSMLVVVSGRLRVSRRDPFGNVNLYNEICSGESVGETGLILQQPRTADVTAVRDSTLAVLERPNFERLLARHPIVLNRVFSQAIFNHLRHTPLAAERPHALSITVIPLGTADGAQRVTQSLALALDRFGRTLRVSSSQRDLGETEANQRADNLENSFDFLVYEAEPSKPEKNLSLFRQADQVIFVASSASPGSARIDERIAAEPGFSMMRKHLVLLHPQNAHSGCDTGKWKTNDAFERIFLVRENNQKDYSRLASFLTNRSVGVVLGGGGARGFAHIGVLKALIEAEIPVDVLGGNSMGALIGAQFACGKPLEDILVDTQRFALGGERPTLPLVSLLSGLRIERDLKFMFGDTLIEKLWQPYFAAACNLSLAETTVQDHGLLWRAVLASNSPAGLMPPVVSRGELLVDGAILDNVPVGAMRQRLSTPLEKRAGNGTVIAVDVDVQRELSVPPSLPRLSVWAGIKNRLSGSPVPLPNIGDILHRAGHIGGLHQRARTKQLADYYLEPPVGRFPLMGYRNAKEIAEVGYRHAADEIERWDKKKLRP